MDKQSSHMSSRAWTVTYQVFLPRDRQCLWQDAVAWLGHIGEKPAFPRSFSSSESSTAPLSFLDCWPHCVSCSSKRQAHRRWWRLPREARRACFLCPAPPRTQRGSFLETCQLDPLHSKASWRNFSLKEKRLRGRELRSTTTKWRPTACA